MAASSRAQRDAVGHGGSRDFKTQHVLGNIKMIRNLFVSVAVVTLIVAYGVYKSKQCREGSETKMLLNLLHLMTATLSLCSAGVYELFSRYQWVRNMLDPEQLMSSALTLIFQLELIRRSLADACRSESVGYLSPYVNMTVDRTQGFPWRWTCFDSSPMVTMKNYCTEYSCEDAGCTSRAMSAGSLAAYAFCACMFPFLTGAKGSTTLLLSTTQVLTIMVVGYATGLDASVWLPAALLHAHITLANVFICGRRHACAKFEFEQLQSLSSISERMGDFLGTLIPRPLHHRLKRQDHKLIAADMEHCTIMFVCLSPSATERSSSLPLETFNLINDVFARLDSVVDKFGYFKYHHVSDTYVICCPRTSHPFHVPDCPIEYREVSSKTMFLLASAMFREVEKFRSISGQVLWAKAGIACGSMAGAVVGTHRRFYCLFGDAINTSARMCHYSEENKVLCTEEFRRNFPPDCGIHFVRRPEMQIKGKGAMSTYFIELGGRYQQKEFSKNTGALQLRRFSQPYVHMDSPTSSGVLEIDDPISAWVEAEEIVSAVDGEHKVDERDAVFLSESMEEKFLIRQYPANLRQVLLGSISCTGMLFIVFFNISQLRFFNEDEAALLRKHIFFAETLGCTMFLLLSFYAVYIYFSASSLEHLEHALQVRAMNRLESWKVMYVFGHLLQFGIMFYCLSWTRTTGWCLSYWPMVAWINLQQTNVSTRWLRRTVVITCPAVFMMSAVLWPNGIRALLMLHVISACYSYLIVRVHQLTERTTWVSQQNHKLEYDAIVGVINDLFPRDVVQEVVANREVAPTYRRAVVLRLDLCDYTRLAVGLQPLEVAKLIHQIYSKFDQTLPDQDIFKLDTIGDEYICAGWLEGGKERDMCSNMFALADTMLSILSAYNFKHKTAVSCRIGIATGFCVAGTMGKLQPRFHIMGEVMDKAVEMQREARPGSVLCSRDFMDILRIR